MSPECHVLAGQALTDFNFTLRYLLFVTANASILPFLATTQAVYGLVFQYPEHS
jgi:hypothetical protein